MRVGNSARAVAARTSKQAGIGAGDSPPRLVGAEAHQSPGHGSRERRQRIRAQAQDVVGVVFAVSANAALLPRVPTSKSAGTAGRSLLPPISTSSVSTSSPWRPGSNRSHLLVRRSAALILTPIQ
jgi:hypothetical protein